MRWHNSPRKARNRSLVALCILLRCHCPLRTPPRSRRSSCWSYTIAFVKPPCFEPAYAPAQGGRSVHSVVGSQHRIESADAMLHSFSTHTPCPYLSTKALSGPSRRVPAQVPALKRRFSPIQRASSAHLRRHIRRTGTLALRAPWTWETRSLTSSDEWAWRLAEERSNP